MLGPKIGYALAGKLATMRAVQWVFARHTTLSVFRAVLKDLAGTYVEAGDQIVGATITARDRLRQEGVSETLLHIMEGIESVHIPNKLRTRVEYSEMVGSYVLARCGGMGHGEALGSLARFFNPRGRPIRN